MAKRKQSPRRDIYQEITESILGYLEEGVVPWRNPIRRAGGNGLPKNLTTGKPYRGVNTFLLAMAALMRGYESDDWATFRQVHQRGGAVRKGEKATLVVFWKQATRSDKETGEEVAIPVLRHYHVFNARQCEGLVATDENEAAISDEPFVPIEEAARIVDGFRNGPTVEHGGSVACYYPATDLVRIPAPERFDRRESYYATLYHEFSHAVGAKGRLDRGIGTRLAPFGSPDYSKEELVAEFGSAFLCAAAGISPPTIEQSAAYIDGWRKKLRDDKKLVIQAAGQGQRAADYILGVTFGDEDEEAERPQVSAPDRKP